MKKLVVLSFLSLALPLFAGKPVAHWDVVPYQRVQGVFKAGVVAFHDGDLKVEFCLHEWTKKKGLLSNKIIVEKPELNDRTNVKEYIYPVDVTKLRDERLTLYAKVIGQGGEICELPPIDIYANQGKSLGSNKEIWLDQENGIDYSEGTKERPVKTMKQAVARAGDGGTVYLAKPGTYNAERVGFAKDRKYWVTICPDPELTIDDVMVKGGRMGSDKIHFKNVQLFSDVSAGQGYIIGGAGEGSTCWVDDCKMFNQGGRIVALSYPFGNKTIGYVTGGMTTEVGNGPCCKLVRNHKIENISGDAFSANDCLAINCELKDVDGTGIVDEPSVHRARPDDPRKGWASNIILANIKATGCKCNGLGGSRVKDSVFTDIDIETIADGNKFCSRYSFEMENVIFNRVNIDGQPFYWNKAKNHYGDFVGKDVRVNECSFDPPPDDAELDM